MLWGREREQAALQELVQRARAGQGGALLLRGQPGVGKSALLEEVAPAGESVVLRTRGVESEAPLPFAALHRLLRPVLGHLDDVPAPQAEALRAAFGETAGPAPDRHLVFLATVNLLSLVGSDTAVVAVVDDAHWLDDASAAALLFAARRLEGESVAVLFAVRDDEPGSFDVRDLPVLDVTGVDIPAATALVAGQAGAEVAPQVLAELREATGGNPLGLLELTGTLTRGQLAGEERLPDRLPLTEGVERAFLDRYRRLPDGAQLLLLVAAADDAGRVATVVGAASVRVRTTTPSPSATRAAAIASLTTSPASKPVSTPPSSWPWAYAEATGTCSTAPPTATPAAYVTRRRSRARTSAPAQARGSTSTTKRASPAARSSPT